MAKPVMTILRTQVVEAKAKGEHPLHGVCDQCAFFHDIERCSAAVDGAAAHAFGGDCMRRDVVYVNAPASGVKGLDE